jgi:hypothetical protein
MNDKKTHNCIHAICARNASHHTFKLPHVVAQRTLEDGADPLEDTQELIQK